MTRLVKLTSAQARRIAVAAQGFNEPRPQGAVTRAHLRRLISRIQVLQLDSVSVAVRAHYAPVFSRLGPYDRDVLDQAAWAHSARSPRLLVEYWAHEAALMAVDDWPLMRWRMRQYRHGRWGTHIVKANPKLADKIVAAIAEIGPSTAGQIEAHLSTAPRGPRGDWWGSRSDTKWVAEALFAAGTLTTATRVGFARHYDLAERVLPAEVLAREVSEDDAVRELTLRAATALGVATEADIRDYFRLAAGQAKPAIAKLVGDGELEPVEVEGWSNPAYLRAGQTIPRRDRGTALLCPFDPLIFSVRGSSGCSGSTIGSRSTRRPTSVNTATTCGRFCSTVSWWGGSTSKPIAPRTLCTSWVRSSRRSSAVAGGRGAGR